MLKQTKAFIEQEKLIVSNDTVLLAVSGGIDSVVMTHLLAALEVKFAIAHCNFQLRGQESEQDQELVKDLAQKNNAPFFEKRFDTSKYASEKGISIQMAARELRYTWFEKIRAENNYSSIAVATHANDEIETTFINIVRGTGIAGLHGIFPKQGNIIRPLLFASRRDIKKYAEDKNINYREDESNADTKYVRNRIRHAVIPVLEEINPGLLATMKKNTENFRNTEKIYQQTIDSKTQQLLKAKNGEWCLEISALRQLDPIQPYLFAILSPFNFTNSVIEAIINQLDGESGKVFLSNTHKLIKDRVKLIIREIKTNTKKNQSVYIKKDDDAISQPVSITFSKYQRRDYTIKIDSFIAAFDMDKLIFPLELRKWKAGDLFQPLGMRGKKKVSDFLIDCKVPLTQKEDTLVLLSKERIIWVVGMRMGETAKVTPQTKTVYEVYFQK